MSYMRTVTVCIGSDHFLFDYADNMSSLANNLSNAVRFRQRQVITAVAKDESLWTDNEREVMAEIRYAYANMKRAPKLPSKGKWFLSYETLDKVLRINKNPDFFVKGLPKQSAQHVIRQAVRDMKSYCEANRSYKKDPSLFSGAPKLPGYKRKGGHTAVMVTNQDCVIKNDNGRSYAYLPYIKKKPLCIGSSLNNAVFKQLVISPDNGRYVFNFQFEVKEELPTVKEKAERICSIDFGVNNLMAVTNNCGLPCVLYKGGAAKSINQGYNKNIAKIVSEQTKGSNEKFKPTEEYYSETICRNDRMSDLMHKCAKHFVKWCVENRIDTVVMGINRRWKQEVNIGHKENQTFVQIPFFKLQGYIKYLCGWNGIKVIEQEESYTSKASFIN